MRCMSGNPCCRIQSRFSRNGFGGGIKDPVAFAESDAPECRVQAGHGFSNAAGGRDKKSAAGFDGAERFMDKIFLAGTDPRIGEWQIFQFIQPQRQPILFNLQKGLPVYTSQCHLLSFLCKSIAR